MNLQGFRRGIDEKFRSVYRASRSRFTGLMRSKPPLGVASGATNEQAVEWIFNLSTYSLEIAYRKHETFIMTVPLSKVQKEDVPKGFLREAVEKGGLEEVQSQYDLLAVYNNLTDREKQLCLNIIKCAATRIAATEAVNMSVNLYWWDETPGDSGPRNAFQHAYWNASMVFCCGLVWAYEFANAHEDRPNNPPLAKAMDLHNNLVGRSVALYAANKSAAEAEIRAMNRNGNLRIYDKDGKALVPSNTYIAEWLEVP